MGAAQMSSRGAASFRLGGFARSKCMPRAATVLTITPPRGFPVEYGSSVEGPDKEPSRWDWMALPLRHAYGGLGLRMPLDEVSDAAFVAGAAQAERSLEGRPAAICPLQSSSDASVRARWSRLHERCAGPCGRDATAKHPPAVCWEQVVAGWGTAARDEGGGRLMPCRMPSYFDLSATQGRRDTAKLGSSSGGPTS